MRYRFLLGAVTLAASSQLAVAQQASFAKQVIPVVSKFCIECHNSTKAKGDVNLENHDAIIKSDILVKGKPADSSFWQTMVGKGPKMPPRTSPQPTAQDVALIRAWIQQGARDDSGGKAAAKAKSAD